MGSVKQKLAGLLVLLPLAGHAGEQGDCVPGSWSPRDLISAPLGGRTGRDPFSPPIQPWTSWPLEDQGDQGYDIT